MRVSGISFVVWLVLAFTGCSKHVMTGVSVDTASRQFIAPDTTVLAGIDLDRLKDSPFYRTHQAQFVIPGLDDATEKIGLNPQRDLSTAVITWNGKDSLAVIRGRFSKVKVEKGFSPNLKRPSYKDATIYADQKNGFALLEDGLGLVGSVPGVHQALDARDANRGDVPGELDNSLAWLSKSDQIWVASRGSLPFADVPTRSDYASLLSNFVGYINGTAAGLQIDDGLHLKARVQCVSTEGGKRVNDALRGGIGLARLSTKDNEMDLLRLYDAIHVKQDGSTVYVNADLSAVQANQLLALITRANRRSPL